MGFTADFHNNSCQMRLPCCVGEQVLTKGAGLSYGWTTSQTAHDTCVEGALNRRNSSLYKGNLSHEDLYISVQVS